MRRSVHSFGGLLAAGARVSVPVNFDAMLNARLAEVKAEKSLSWLSPAVYLQFGTATAVLAVMFFAAQYSDLFSNNNYQALSAASASQINTEFPNSLRATAPPPPATGYGFESGMSRSVCDTMPCELIGSRLERLTSMSA